jgi:hypothetical protein
MLLSSSGAKEFGNTIKAEQLTILLALRFAGRKIICKVGMLTVCGIATWEAGKVRQFPSP